MDLPEKQNCTEQPTDVQIKVQHLESENKRLQEEFDSQRAKLKDLFLQKEDELVRKTKEKLALTEQVAKLQTQLDEAKSQLVVADMTLETNLDAEKRKANAEIASLQQLVHETVEESSTSKAIYDSEVKKFHAIIQQLENDLELKNERQQSPHHVVQEQSSLAPSVMLSAVTKTLARKLGADTFSSSQDNMEDSMRKVDDDHAQEDAEVLRSLVVPLEEEIKALKDKLRSTDDQLQKCQQCRHVPEQEAVKTPGDLSSITPNATQTATDPQQFLSSATNTSFDSQKYPGEPHSPAKPCDMCSNYEAELVKEQHKVGELEGKIATTEKAAERHREELLKEIGFRKEIEEKWNEKKEEHKQQVAELTRRTECAEQDLKELQQTFKQEQTEIRQHLSSLTQDREKVHRELEKLQKENDNLVGKYSIHSQQLQSEIINLPNVVEELHELILKSHQELIIAKIGKEAAEEQANTLRSDIMLLKDQITNDQQMKESLENSLVAEITSLKSQKDHLEKEQKHFLAVQEKLESLDKTHKGTLMQLDEVYNTKRHLEDHINELKSRVASLQHELDNSEVVQKDFVRLSQSLQVQLEKIRDSDAQVRWQHEEDTDECPTCRAAFSTTKRKKLHCRHCGQIFCVACLSHTVLSGPNQRPSKVCDVCHTLLVKSSAPYFSTEAPHSPD